jgi:hypothetical protein
VPGKLLLVGALIVTAIAFDYTSTLNADISFHSCGP